MLIYSFDGAPTNLGVCILEFNGELKIQKVYTKNLIPDKKVKDTTKIERLQNLLKHLDSISETPDLVVIEKIMAPNFKATEISDAIITYYLMKKVVVHEISPARKNKIVMTPEITYQACMEKYNKAYDANKYHCYLLFKYWCEKNQPDILKQLPVRTKCYDMADAFCQAYYIIYLS